MKIIKQSICLAFLILQIIQSMSAQEVRKISGTVTDAETGYPVPGVNISIVGTQHGTISDINGIYQLDIPGNETTIHISFIGYESQEIHVGTQSQINIELFESSELLEEVVVVGYGEMKKSDLTGSIASIKSDELNAVPVVKLDHALQGAAPGVFVTNNSAQPGGETVIRIRGINSLIGDNDPLYVIDGYVGGDINTIPASDVISIEVLKDASATSIYGARGANGVVLITTKAGKSGQNRISFSSYFGWQKVTNKLDLMDGPAFTRFIDSLYTARGIPIIPYPEPDSMESYDWQDEMFTSAPMQNYSLSASGGNEDINYYISGNYVQRDGVTRNSYYGRYNVRANIDARVKKWLKVGGRLGYSDADRSRNLEENMNRSGTGHPVAVALRMAPIVTPYDEEGNLLNEIQPVEGPRTGNPLYVQEYRLDHVLERTTIGNIYTEIDLLEGLMFKSSMGFDYRTNKNNIYKPSHVTDAVQLNRSYAEVNTWQRMTWLNENFISYNKDFMNSRLMALAGLSANASQYERHVSKAYDFTLDGFEYHSMQSGSQPTFSITTGESAYSRLSYFGRVHYNLREKYLFTFNGRMDGSSRFGYNNKWSFFPSGAFAWRISQEDFMEGSKQIINRLKFRASYGVSGSEAIDPYKSWTLMSAEERGYILNDIQVPCYLPKIMGDPNLGWEQTAQLDIGFDAGFLKNRINVVIDYFHKVTSELFVNAPVEYTTGFGSQLTNIGNLKNEGFELAVNARILDGDFSWNIDGNITHQRSKILDLGLKTDVETGFEEYISGGTNQFGSVQVVRVGEALGAYYGYETDGFWNDTTGAPTQFGMTAKPGDLKFVDQDNDGNISDLDRIVLGKQQPTWYGGLNSIFTWKGIELALFFQYVIDVDVLNATRQMVTNLNNMENKLAEVEGNTWTPDNPDALYPRIGYTTPYSLVDVYLEDGSFLRLRDLTLAYTVPEKYLDKINISNLRIYITGSNLWLLTNYSGYDPEVNIYRGSDRADYGVLVMDNGSYPRARSLLLGINFSF